MNQTSLLLRLFLGLCLVLILTSKNIFAEIQTQNNNKKVSINFSNISIKDLLRLLARHSNKNIIISEKVDGKININLHDSSWKEALNIILQLQHLAKYETENTITIITQEEFDKNTQLAKSITTFNLHHIEADKIAKILPPSGILSPEGKAEAEVRTNTLIVSDTKERIDNLKNLIKQVDIAAKQVLIEAKIVSADDNFMRNLGLEFNLLESSPITNQQKTINTPRALSEKLDFTIAKLKNKTLLNLELTALENEGRGKIISSPKLLTSDRQEAYIESGAEIPYQEKTTKGNTSIAFKKAVLSLKVTPEVIDEHSINLLLQLNQDKVSQLTVKGVPAIDTRKIQTQVLVKNGETIILGGVYEWGNSKHIVGIPVLRKIPIVGRLFYKQEIKTERKELLMFITPSIIK